MAVALRGGRAPLDLRADVLIRVGALLLVVLLACVAVNACHVGDLDLDNRGCPCGSGFVCDAARDLCVRGTLLEAGADGSVACRGPGCACGTDPDCADPAYPKCVANTCVACTSSPDGCAAGTYCLPSHECAPGCKASAECAALSPSSPFCNVQRHQCVQCAASGDCSDGLQCTPAGTCVKTCTGQGTKCPDGTSTCCGGLCIDTTSDPLNCNACGGACAGADTLCCASQCTNPLTSVGNCGKCGAACNSRTHANGSGCSAGACTFACESGFGHCATGNTGCEAPINTATACGSCANNCSVVVKNASGVSCQGGTKCAYTACNAGFYELDGNTSNGCEPCGARGQYCCPGNICNGGSDCEPAPANDGRCH